MVATIGRQDHLPDLPAVQAVTVFHRDDGVPLVPMDVPLTLRAHQMPFQILLRPAPRSKRADELIPQRAEPLTHLQPPRLFAVRRTLPRLDLIFSALICG